ncbi:MAG: hypothetical protein J3R72DRAFT_475850 [Linnemannia gamsii]|nr:MAG: hypothetical protein J3R72DRAFT_475850 [Linnemannia gamsii]
MDPKPTTTPAPPKPKPTPVKPPTNPTTTPAQPKKTTTAGNGGVLPPSSSTTPTISPSPTPEADSSTAGGGLPVGAIAGIAAGGALILMFVVSIFVCKKRRARRYAARPDGHDSSRDPIDPSEVLPRDNKYDQRTPILTHSSAAVGGAVGAVGALSSSRSGNSRDGDSGFISYPLALRGASEEDSKARELAAYQDPRTQQTQRALEQEYSHYEDHIQSHFEPDSPQMSPASLRPGPGPASPTKDLAQNNINNNNINRAQHLPTPILTSNPSMELSRNTPAPMSPSQRNFQQQQESSPISPRSRPAHPLSSPSGPRGQDAVIVNDMGNEFVMQSSNNSRRDSFEQDGSVVQSELSYRRGVPPRKSQESNLGGGSAPPSGVLHYPASGTPSPMALGPQRGPGSGERPGPGSNSTFSSPHQRPSGYPASPPVRPSQYQPQPQHQYQPPPQGYQQQQQSSYQQYPQDSMNGYGSPPMRPQQPRQGGGGGYPGGPGSPGGMRSPPMSPQSRGPGGYSPHMGPGYPQQQQQYQQQYQPQSNYAPPPQQQQQSPNYRPRHNNNNY